MVEVTTIGLDLAKTVLQVHGVNAAGAVVVRRSLRRKQVLAFFAMLPRCLIGIEACATAHHWARELAQLSHDVRLIRPAYAKAYVEQERRGQSLSSGRPTAGPVGRGDLRGGEPAVDALCAG